jgi:hypothetical protein
MRYKSDIIRVDPQSDTFILIDCPFFLFTEKLFGFSKFKLNISLLFYSCQLILTTIFFF